MPGDDALISPSAAARLWRVSRTTVYGWHAAGRLPCFHARRRGGPLSATLREVRAAKVLTESSTLLEEIPARILESAIRSEVVTPADGRFSLDDVDELKRLAALGHVAPGSPIPRRSSGIRLASFRWAVEDEVAWVRAGADPAQLPDGYWATPVPPRLIPPADVFYYELGERRSETQFIRRSEGYEKRSEDFVWCQAKERFHRLRVGDSMPRAWVESSHRWAIAAEQWLREWQRRKHHGHTG